MDEILFFSDSSTLFLFNSKYSTSFDLIGLLNIKSDLNLINGKLIRIEDFYLINGELIRIQDVTIVEEFKVSNKSVIFCIFGVVILISTYNLGGFDIYGILLRLNLML